MSRVACEAASCTGFVLVTGEITTKAQLDVPAIVRKTVNEIGYNDAKTGFDGNTCAVMQPTRHRNLCHTRSLWHTSWHYSLPK